VTPPPTFYFDVGIGFFRASQSAEVARRFLRTMFRQEVLRLLFFFFLNFIVRHKVKMGDGSKRALTRCPRIFPLCNPSTGLERGRQLTCFPLFQTNGEQRPKRIRGGVKSHVRFSRNEIKCLWYDFAAGHEFGVHSTLLLPQPRMKRSGCIHLCSLPSSPFCQCYCHPFCLLTGKPRFARRVPMSPS